MAIALPSSRLWAPATGGPPYTVASFASASSQYLSITDAAQSGLNLASDHTWSLWAKPTLSGGDDGFIGKDHGGSGRGLQINASGSAKLRYKHANSSDVEVKCWSGSDGLTDAVWQHILCQFDSAAEEMRIFINGSADGTLSIASLLQGSVKFCIGQRGDDTDYYNGLMAFVACWDVALSGAQITTLYNSGSPLEYADTLQTDMVSFWALNEAGGTTRVDSHGSNDLTDFNTVGTDTWTP